MGDQDVTILVVDDEPVSLMMLKRLLASKYRVLTAESGHEALKIIDRDNITLLITDQRMPGMNGADLLCKARALNSEMIGIVITSNDDTETFLQSVLKAGAVRVVGKPWDPDKLLDLVVSCLQKYEDNKKNKLALGVLQSVKRNLENF